MVAGMEQVTEPMYPILEIRRERTLSTEKTQESSLSAVIEMGRSQGKHRSSGRTRAMAQSSNEVSRLTSSQCGALK